MKRSRRVVLTLMGTATVSAVSTGLAQAARLCGPGLEAVPGIDGRPYCRPIVGGFGGTLHTMHSHGHGGYSGG
jgi:hypothetical protein